MGRGARLAAAAALSLCGCSGLEVGLRKDGVVVEAAVGGTAPAPSGEGERLPSGDDGPMAIVEAERQAVDQVLDLIVSTGTRAVAAAALQESVWSRRPRAYIRRYRVEPAPAGKTRLLALVSTARLLQELDELGLVRPEAVQGTPRVLVSLQESGPGRGRASDALRRQLAARGYEAQDSSDGRAPQRKGARSEGLTFSGTAAAERLGEARLAGYESWRGRVSGTAAWAAGREVLADVSAEATAVDLASATAAAKALENAGGLAAEKLAAALSDRFRERSRIDLAALGLENLARIRRFVCDVRGLPGVAAATVVGLEPREVRLRLFVERVVPGDLALLLRRMPGYAFEIRSVDADHRYVEAEATGGR